MLPSGGNPRFTHITIANGQPRLRNIATAAVSTPPPRLTGARASAVSAAAASYHLPPAPAGSVIRPEVNPEQILKSDRTIKPWGWTTMDNVIVPYIMRGNEKFVSVKMVESKLLSRFPKINMEDMTNVGPIYSFYVTDQEAKLLTEINTRCYNHGFGAKSFTTKDLIVSLENFTSFYTRAKKHFESKMAAEGQPPPAPATSPGTINTNNSRVPTPGHVEGGWVQINNTVTPYLLRAGVKFVPLSVIKFAAGLLIDTRLDGYKTPVATNEYHFLNNACRSARINFQFSVKTKLIKLEHVIRMSQSKVNITELPPNEPFLHAQFQQDRQSPQEVANGIVQSQSNFHMPIAQPQLSAGAHLVQGHQGQVDPQQVSPPQLLQPMPPRNPFVQQGLRPAQMMPYGHQQLQQHQQQSVTSIPAQYLNRAGISASALQRARGRDIRTPSPSISPRTQQLQLQQAAAAGVALRVPRPQSTSGSRPSSAQSRSSITPPEAMTSQQPTSSDFVLNTIKYEHKNFLCILRGTEREPYVLLEALQKIFFPTCSFSDFQSALEQTLNIPVVKLTPAEEMAVIRFYKLNVKALRTKLITPLLMFKKWHRDLQYLLKADDSTSPSATSPSATSQDSTEDLNAQNAAGVANLTSNQQQQISTQGTNQNKDPATTAQPITAEAAPKTELTSKRKRSVPVQFNSRKSKQFCKRLEDTVAKLRMRQEPANDVGDAEQKDADVSSASKHMEATGMATAVDESNNSETAAVESNDAAVVDESNDAAVVDESCESTANAAVVDKSIECVDKIDKIAEKAEAISVVNAQDADVTMGDETPNDALPDLQGVGVSNKATNNAAGGDIADASIPDEVLVDSDLPDEVPADSNVMEASIPDEVPADSNFAEASVPDEVLADSKLAEASVPDEVLADGLNGKSAVSGKVFVVAPENSLDTMVTTAAENETSNATKAQLAIGDGNLLALQTDEMMTGELSDDDDDMDMSQSLVTADSVAQHRSEAHAATPQPSTVDNSDASMTPQTSVTALQEDPLSLVAPNTKLTSDDVNVSLMRMHADGADTSLAEADVMKDTDEADTANRVEDMLESAAEQPVDQQKNTSEMEADTLNTSSAGAGVNDVRHGDEGLNKELYDDDEEEEDLLHLPAAGLMIVNEPGNNVDMEDDEADVADDQMLGSSDIADLQSPHDDDMTLLELSHESDDVDTGPSTVDAESSAVNAESSAVNAEPSAINAEPSAINAGTSAVDTETSAVDAGTSVVDVVTSAVDVVSSAVDAGAANNASQQVANVESTTNDDVVTPDTA